MKVERNDKDFGWNSIRNLLSIENLSNWFHPNIVVWIKKCIGQKLVMRKGYEIIRCNNGSAHENDQNLSFLEHGSKISFWNGVMKTLKVMNEKAENWSEGNSKNLFQTLVLKNTLFENIDESSSVAERKVMTVNDFRWRKLKNFPEKKEFSRVHLNYGEEESII